MKQKPLEWFDGQALSVIFLKNVSTTVIVNEDGDEVEKEVAKPAPYAIKSIYFLPDCTAHELAGRTGGENFGVLAKIPVLVH